MEDSAFWAWAKDEMCDSSPDYDHSYLDAEKERVAAMRTSVNKSVHLAALQGLSVLLKQKEWCGDRPLEEAAYAREVKRCSPCKASTPWGCELFLLPLQVFSTCQDALNACSAKRMEEVKEVLAIWEAEDKLASKHMSVSTEEACALSTKPDIQVVCRCSFDCVMFFSAVMFAAPCTIITNWFHSIQLSQLICAVCVQYYSEKLFRQFQTNSLIIKTFTAADEQSEMLEVQ